MHAVSSGSRRTLRKVRAEMASNAAPRRDTPQWWKQLVDCDPISLEPLSELPCPPFALGGGEAGAEHLFDPACLADYLTSTATFENPMNRAPLTRDDCRRLDMHVRQYRMGRPNVCDAFDLSKRARATAGRDGELDAGRGTLLQREAATVMTSLFQFAPYVPPSAPRRRVGGEGGGGGGGAGGAAAAAAAAAAGGGGVAWDALLGEEPTRWPPGALQRRNKEAVKAAKALLGKAQFGSFRALAAGLRGGAVGGADFYDRVVLLFGAPPKNAAAAAGGHAAAPPRKLGAAAAKVFLKVVSMLPEKDLRQQLRRVHASRCLPPAAAAAAAAAGTAGAAGSAAAAASAAAAGGTQPAGVGAAELVLGFVFSAMRALSRVLAHRAAAAGAGGAPAVAPSSAALELPAAQQAALGEAVRRIEVRAAATAPFDAAQFLNVGLLAEVGLSEAGCGAVHESAARHFRAGSGGEAAGACDEEALRALPGHDVLLLHKYMRLSRDALALHVAGAGAAAPAARGSGALAAAFVEREERRLRRQAVERFQDDCEDEEAEAALR